MVLLNTCSLLAACNRGDQYEQLTIWQCRTFRFDFIPEYKTLPYPCIKSEYIFPSKIWHFFFKLKFSFSYVSASREGSSFATGSRGVEVVSFTIAEYRLSGHKCSEH
jgi:hypothetical protein